MQTKHLTNHRAVYGASSPITASETRLAKAGASAGAIIGAIIGVLLLIALIVTAVVIFRKKRMNNDAPPTHKPPPPMKYTMTSDRNANPTLAVPDPVSESPLMYYETQKTEPMTDLDSYHGEDEDGDDPQALHNSAPFSWEEEEMEGNVDGDDQQLSPIVSRVDSFVSPAVIV